MAQLEENNMSVLDISGFSEISEISCVESLEANKSIEFDINSELTLGDLKLDCIVDFNPNDLNYLFEFENFIESVGDDLMSKSHYILYDINGKKLYLDKNQVVYQTDTKGNRQYYLIPDDTPLFQNLNMVNQYISKCK